MDVFRKIKHARWEVNQERDKTEEEEPAEELENPRRVAQVRESKHIPEHLEQNHVEEETDVAEGLALWRAQEIPFWRLFWRREISVDQIRLHDGKKQDSEDRRNKDGRGVHRAFAEKEVPKARQYRRTNHQIQAKIEKRIE